jgi:hypothetical protein
MGIIMYTKSLVFCLVFFYSISLALGQTDSQKNEIDSTVEKFQVALVMPFCSANLIEDPKHKNAAIGNACRNYYEGFLLALDSFKTNEKPIFIKVYDTKRDSLSFAKIINKKEVLNADLIIGPVLKEGNELMVDYCKKNKRYHVSPFLTLTKSTINNPYLISVYPDLNYYADFILEDIEKSKKESVNIFVAFGKESNDKIISSRISALKTKYPQFVFKQIEISKISEFSKNYNSLKTNFFILASENEFAVGSALKNLSDTTRFTNVQVYGFRKWLEFKAPNITLLEKLNVKIISPHFFDYYAASNKSFIGAYRERFHTDPEEYAIAGFEQGLFFLQTMVQVKGNMKEITKLNKLQPLSNKYLIRQKEGSKSLQNAALNVLFFEEGRLKRKD